MILRQRAWLDDKFQRTVGVPSSGRDQLQPASVCERGARSVTGAGIDSRPP
jgi:hypothetical protein